MLPKITPAKKTIYLDHAATTYLDPRVEKAMQPFWRAEYGNPSSLYKQGRDGAGAIARARKTISEIINSKPSEIIFTAGGTESINLAIFGIARQYELTYKKKGHIITSAIEHDAVLSSYRALAEEGWKISIIKVNSEGFIDIATLKAAVRKDTVLISVMYANNEIGTIEPITEIGKWVIGLNSARAKQKLPRIYFHSDACQAGGSLDLDTHKLGVDLLTVNGSKLYGPKQTGFLFIKSGARLRPLLFGGGQERDLRSGTENVAGIVGLAEALRLAQKDRLKENKRLITLRNYLRKVLLKKIPDTVVNGPTEDELRLPNNLNLSFNNIDGEALLLYLDSYNIAVSTGSACSSTSTDPSHVIEAIGRKPEYVKGSIRFTLGHATTKQDLDFVLKLLPDLVAELRRIN